MSENLASEQRNSNGAPSLEISSSIDSLWSALRNLVDNFNDSKTQRISLSDKLAELEASENETQGKFENLNARFNELESNFNTVVNDKQRLEQENRQKEAELKNSSATSDELKNLKYEYSKLKETLQGMEAKVLSIPELNQKLHDSEARAEELIKEKASLEKDINSLEDIRNNFELAQKGIAKKNHELHKRAEEISALKDTIAELDNKLFETKDSTQSKKIDELKKTIDGLNIQLELEKSNRREEEEQFKRELGKYKQIWETQEESLDDKTRKLNEIQSKYDELANNHKRQESDKVLNLQKLMADKDAEINELKDLKSLLKTENKELNEKIKGIESKLESDSALVEKTSKEAQEKISKLTNDLENKDILISNYTDNLKKFNELNSTNEKTIEELLDNIKKLEAQINTMEANAPQEGLIDDLQNQLLTKDKLIDEYTTQIMNMEIRDEEKENAINNLKEDLASLKDSIKFENIDNDEKLKKIKEEKNILETRYNDNTELLKSAESNINELQKNLNEKDHQISLLERSLEESNAVKLDNYSTIQDLQEELNIIKKKYENFDVEIKAYSDQVDDYQKENDELLNNLEDSDRKIAELEKELEESNAKYVKLNDDMLELDKLRIQTEEKNKLIKDYSSHIRNLDAINLKNFNEIKKLKEDIESLTSEKEDRKSGKAELEAAIKLKEEELEHYDAKFKDVSKQNLVQYEKIKQLENQVQLEKNESLLKDKIINDLKTDCSKVVTENKEKEQLINTNKQLEKKYLDLEEELQTLNISNKTLSTGQKELNSALFQTKEEKIKLENSVYLLLKEKEELSSRVNEFNEMMLKLQSTLESKDELLQTLEDKIARYEHQNSGENLKKAVLISKIEDYMKKLEKVINNG